MTIKQDIETLAEEICSMEDLRIWITFTRRGHTQCVWLCFKNYLKIVENVVL